MLGPDTVSYTHLDVYKRQPQINYDMKFNPRGIVVQSPFLPVAERSRNTAKKIATQSPALPSSFSEGTRPN